MTTLGPQQLGLPHSNTTGGFENEISLYKEFLGNNATKIPINTNFVVNIKSLPGLLQDGNKLRQLEEEWNIDNTVKALNEVFKSNKAGEGASFFVNGITNPVESVGVTRQGMQDLFSEHSGGLLSGVVSTAREQQKPLDISFLETNYSFVDFVIRPWITLLSHYGLIARPSNLDLKTTITAVYYTTEATSKEKRVRKYFKFEGAAPVSISSPGPSAYGTTQIGVYPATWTYTKYMIKDVAN